LKKVGQLQDLTLRFESCEFIKDRSMVNFSETLGQLLSLKNLHLNFKRYKDLRETFYLILFRCDYLTNDGFINLNLGLRKLSKLEVLHLDFGW